MQQRVDLRDETRGHICAQSNRFPLVIESRRDVEDMQNRCDGEVYCLPC